MIAYDKSYIFTAWNICLIIVSFSNNSFVDGERTCVGINDTRLKVVP